MRVHIALMETKLGEANGVQLFSERETARLLSVSRASLRLWRSRGEGPEWVRAGRRLVRYSALALRDWIERQSGVGIATSMKNAAGRGCKGKVCEQRQ